MIVKMETNRFVIEIIPSTNWKQGQPINPKVQKWLVQVYDKYTHDCYCPNDQEFAFLKATMADHELALLSGALKIKETHNRANLKNPEKRAIEDQIHAAVSAKEWEASSS